MVNEEDKAMLAKSKLEQKLREYGSVELMANLAVMETVIQSPTFHNPANTLAEKPFMAYTLGLFLSNNNIHAGEPHFKQFKEFVSILEDYLKESEIMWMNLENQKPTGEDSIAFESKLIKVLEDANPHAYPNQKNDHYEKVFSPLDEYFVSEYGFSADYIIKFTENFIYRINIFVNERLELAGKKCEETEKQLQQPQSKLLEKWKKKNMTPEYVLALYTEFVMYGNSKHILTINVDEYCNEQGIIDKYTFKMFLNKLSCSFGDQFEGFDDLLSDNIIFYKPIIKLDEDTFFVPKPDFLQNKLDRILEYLLEKEKNKKGVWDDFTCLKSKYVEDRAFDFVSRIFPPECIFQNGYYWSENERKEVDLLVIYDNKIFIMESKSGALSLEAKRDGRNKLRNKLEDLVKKALQQCTDARDYIKSQPKAVFWKDPRKEEILVEIDYASTNYEFFFINVTLEYLDGIGTNLKNLEPFKFFENGEYPYAVYLHDLDIITDLLSEPIYFIHYIQQRIVAQNQNIFQPHSELNILGYYLIHGTFVPEIMGPGNFAKTHLLPDFMDSIESYYLFSGEKPRVTIPKKLEELLLNMQKYRQRGFTDITSVLLDFPQLEKKKIADLLGKKFNNTVKKGTRDGFTAMLSNPFNIGFSYHTANNMEGFYKGCKDIYQQNKSESEIKRWAIIGRNVCDKKNYATFFIYDDGKL